MSDQPKPPYEFGQGAPSSAAAAPPHAQGQQSSAEPDPDALAMARVRPIIEAAEQASVAIIAEAEAQAQRYVEESRRRADEIAASRARDMWTMTDDLIARGEAVRQRSDELLAALAYAKQGLEQALRAEASRPSVDPAPPQPQAPPFAPPTSRPTAPPQQAAPPPPAPPPPPPLPPAAPLQPPAPPAPLVGAAADPAPPPFHPPAPESAPPPPTAAGPQPSEGARLLATQMAVAGSNREEIANRLYSEFGVQEPGPMLDVILGPGA